MPPPATPTDVLATLRARFAGHSTNPFTRAQAEELAASMPPCPMCAVHEANSLPMPRDASSGYPVRSIGGMVVSFDPDADSNIRNPLLTMKLYHSAAYVPRG